MLAGGTPRAGLSECFPTLLINTEALAKHEAGIRLTSRSLPEASDVPTYP